MLLVSGKGNVKLCQHTCPLKLLQFLLIQEVLVLTATTKVKYRLTNFLPCNREEKLCEIPMLYYYTQVVSKRVQASPCSFCHALSWMKPMKGAMPVPGPIMIIGLLGLNGSRNWDLLTYMGTVCLWPLSVTSLFISQLVATPLKTLSVLVVYSITTAQMWTEVGWTWNEGEQSLCQPQGF